jgi:hypothetical protein
MRRRAPALFLCLAVALTAYVLLDFWSSRNGPLYSRLERQWGEDVDDLEASKKLPKEWFDVGTIELIGGTPETKEWLQRIHVPLAPKKGGHFKLEILVVAWEEEGKHGALVQYDLVDPKTQNNFWERGRTFILSKPRNKDSLKAFLEEFVP